MVDEVKLSKAKRILEIIGNVAHKIKDALTSCGKAS